MSFTQSDIEAYCEGHSTQLSDVCQEIITYTKENVDMPQMLMGQLGCLILKQFVAISHAQRILEIGCFTGLTALAMAEAMPSTGRVITLDINAETNKIARSFWAKSVHGSKIEPLIGPALDSIKKLAGEFEVIFVDADKGNYGNYFEACASLVARRGVMIFDNTLWSGSVLENGNKDEETQAIKALNDKLVSLKNWEVIQLPVRDGITIARRTA
ncbi:MAG: class I SAM-dependent methyltransferase [Deltaproteobacteria bacterium]|nr:class I SAM-dependent methyltransferase [Deltaproteobacteria bacterium]